MLDDGVGRLEQWNSCGQKKVGFLWNFRSLPSSVFITIYSEIRNSSRVYNCGDVFYRSGLSDESSKMRLNNALLVPTALVTGNFTL